MIKILMGKKGTGKTKVFIDMVNEALHSESGNVVCINKDNRLMYDLKKDIRLVDTNEFKFADFDTFYGFICGIISQNYDISHIFIDSVLKIVPVEVSAVNSFIKELEELSKVFNIKFTFTISADIENATDEIKKYLQRI